jgi:hypothetical protein
LFYTNNFFSKKKKILSNNNLVCPFSWPQIFLYKKICKKWNFLSINNLLWMFRDVFLFCIWQWNFREACFDHPQGKRMFIYIYTKLMVELFNYKYFHTSGSLSWQYNSVGNTAKLISRIDIFLTVDNTTLKFVLDLFQYKKRS